jgi:hypothetical protein
MVGGLFKRLMLASHGCDCVQVEHSSIQPYHQWLFVVAQCKARGSILAAAHGQTVFYSALEKLQDRAPPRPLSEVRKVLQQELGHSIEELFATFEPEPAAAASLAQVTRL